MTIKEKSFAVIGGGTGTFSVLSGLKRYTSKISAIVTMADSGGSAKKERDEWGILPSSDIRKSLIALADVKTDDSLLLRKLFQYRFSEGKGVEGVTFGNLFLVGLTKLLGSQTKAIEKAGELLRIKGRVLPVSTDTIDLVATYKDGTTVVGEHFIDEPEHNGTVPIVKLTTKPKATITDEAREAILAADCIIIGPGGFYTTILANLVVDGVRDAIMKSRGIKIFILNLMTEYGQAYRFSASGYLTELDKYLPNEIIDFVFINDESIPANILTKYKRENAQMVLNDLPAKTTYRVLSGDILSKASVKREKSDTLRRSLIRHSPEKIARMCMKALNLV